VRNVRFLKGLGKTLGTLDVEHDGEGEQETEKGRKRRGSGDVNARGG
jgi:hypothetical protein